MSESNLADELAEGKGDAEKLIAASRARYTGGLAAAQLREASPDAEIDFDEVAKAAGVKKVIAAEQRGEDIVYVSEGEDGRTSKGIVPVADLGKKGKAAKKAEKDESKG